MYSGHPPSRTVYPRWRGGTFVNLRVQDCQRGLSPLARGNHQSKNLNRIRFRSIPAGAGEPPVKEPEPHPVPVYPRWRGGTSWELLDRGSRCGLSPLARGNPMFFYGAVVISGSIPAGAGEP